MIRQLNYKEFQGLQLVTDSITGWDLAEKVFGWKDYKTTYSEAFVYFFRRFGAPETGSDDYKELCNYFITTPTKGFYLNARFSSYGFLSFSLCGKDQNLYADLKMESRKPYTEWHERKRAWMSETFVDYFDPYSIDASELQIKFNEWFEQNKTRFKGENENSESVWKKRHQIFFEEVEKRNESYAEKYAEPFPENPDIETPLNDKINAIFEKALRELLNPVYIRDTYCNILGRVPDENLKETKTRAYYKNSGYGYVSSALQSK